MSALWLTRHRSTYIVAWVVGEYDYVEDKTAEGVVMRCYTPVGKTAQGHFALSVGVRALSYFTKIFGTQRQRLACGTA